MTMSLRRRYVGLTPVLAAGATLVAAAAGRVSPLPDFPRVLNATVTPKTVKSLVLTSNGGGITDPFTAT